MAHEQELSAAIPIGRTVAASTFWRFSWPLLVGISAYLYALFRGKDLFLDGDTYWHVATGQWILDHGAVPKVDPFSHTMPGAPWTAHEWLSEVVMALAHQAGGWNALAVITAIAFAVTMGLMTRALLRWLEPIYALLFVGAAVSMTSGHLLVRPHMLAMPLMMLWTIELVCASEARRAPRWWALAVLAVWANLHGGFTLGIALACAFMAEAVLTADKPKRVATAKAWGGFVALAVATALLTPHGIQGIRYTWELLFQHGYALERVGEWRSPDFHILQPLELWLLGGLAVVMTQGLRLPPIRLILLVALLHLSLKYQRSVELVGLLAPLFLAAPFAAQWRSRQAAQQFSVADRWFGHLAQPAGRGALLAALLLVAGASVWNANARPLVLPEGPAPAAALRAVQQAGIKGRVLNSYLSGGYLIYSGIPVFIDGRGDMYGDAFMREYLEALDLKKADGLEKLLRKYKITWTLLDAGEPAVTLLDHLPQWRRLYADDSAVVHIRVRPLPEEPEPPIVKPDLSQR